MAIRSIRREAEVGRHSSHPNLVPILEACVDVPVPHVVMPRLMGASLGTVIAKVGRLTVPQSLWFARQVAQALRHLHEQGWVHGDVKPSNVVVSADGHATLIDLGFALRKSEALLTEIRTARGTLDYVAPEVMTSAFSADDRGDLYSLGISLFHMLTGKLPFVGRTPGPLIIAGDANATDISQPYRTIHNAGLQDAWRVAGFGLGGTFPGSTVSGSSRWKIGSWYAPQWMLRIDYVFVSPHWEVSSARIARL